MIDPFTPWQEVPSVLQKRTVGQDDVLDWLVDTIDASLSGKDRSWCLVVGPRGAGKSHLLQLARAGCTRPKSVIWVPEDSPTVNTAERLWQQIWEKQDPWGWEIREPVKGTRLLFIEGLDRILTGLSETEQWAFRHRLTEADCFVVGTALTASIAAAADGPFHGQFDPWVLEPLSLEQSRALFVLVSEEQQDAPATTMTRRAALTQLAGGSPRAIVTLADAVRGATADQVGTAEALLGAVQRLVTHYQQRFHDLPPLSQQIVVALAKAPIELTGTQVKHFAQASSAAVAGAARALETSGALERVQDAQDGRITRYRLTEPLFRYWLEYRTIPSWQDARVSWLGRMLGEVMSREELLNVWWSSTDPQVRAAVERTTHDALRMDVLWKRMQSEQDVALVVDRYLSSGLERHVEFGYDLFLRRPDLLAAFAHRFPQDVALTALNDFAFSSLPPKPRFVRLLSMLSDVSGVDWSYVDRLVAAIMQGWTSQGRPWSEFRGSDAALLASVPLLRMRFATEGRRPTHEPLLSWTQIQKLSVTHTMPDLHAYIATCHQRDDQEGLMRGLACTRRLPTCPRPERPAAALANHLNLLSDDLWGPTWAASWSVLSNSDFTSLLERLKGLDWEDHDLWVSECTTAFLALATRSPGRFEQVRVALPKVSSVQKAAQILRQLRERENGPLQSELELVWQSVAPPEMQ